MFLPLTLGAILSAPIQHQQIAPGKPMSQWPISKVVPLNPQEKHFKKLVQLTFGGQNAEAYWSLDGKKLTYQTLQPEYPDEQIFTMNIDGSHKKLISTGKGRCTCSYFSPDGRYVYFSSTHEKNEGPQKAVDHSKGYVWMVNPDFNMYRRNLRTNKLETVYQTDGYVAETTIDPKGKYLTFTSDKDGDLEIYRSDMNGKNVKRLTYHPGYDGGPFVSWDGKKIVYRRDVISTPDELADYQSLLKDHLVRPTKLEIWIMTADGKYNHQVTNLGGASFAPFLMPDGKRIIFCSNFEDPKGREFDLYMINTDGTHLERVTYTGDFDGFPMLTKDGKKLVFCSNRYGSVPHETNIFVADWKD
ncbi:MAG: PD40 domain-containing protein [Armatimonadetes bacterium]|nr:PD40 domain-containing protein [Armatimonadota bacterium]